MRRAMRRIVLGSCAIGLLAAGSTLAQHADVHTEKTAVPIIDAIGLIDRTRPPSFKIGTFAKYRSYGKSLAGRETDYDMIIVVAGEELFWGEECFWLETGTAPRGQTPIILSTLVSYAAFDTTLPEAPIAYFQRKTIMETDKDGNAIQTILKRATQAIVTKDKGKGFTQLVDTLGTETISTPAGDFECLKVRLQKGVGATEEMGDSTRYTEQRETRINYHSPKIPITGLARTDIEVTEHRRTWKVGASSEVPQILVDKSTLRTDVIEFGEGREAQVTPEAYWRPIKRATAAARAKR